MGDYRLQAIREFVQTLLKDGRCLSEEGNVLYCEKLFIINSVMKWLYTRIAEESMELSEMKAYLHHINQFLDDEATLQWIDGSVVAEPINSSKGK